MTRQPRKLEQVVEASIVEFQKNGFTAANMDRISDRAQVSKRTLYNYFESKEALFQEIVKRASEHFTDTEPSEFSPDAEVTPQLYQLAIRLTHPYTDPAAVKMARLIIGETLRNREMAAEMLTDIELATSAESFFRSAATVGAISEQAKDELVVNFPAFLKGRCFWPAILSGKVVSQSEVEKAAKSASELFAGQFV